MGIVEIGELFDESRLPSGLRLFLFILYCPLGLVLAVLRLFIGLHTFLVACLLPKITTLRSVVLRSLCSILGICVSRENTQNRDPKVKMLVVNYTSALDHLAVDLVLPNIMPSVWDLPPLLMWVLGYKDMGAKQGRQTLIQNTGQHCQSAAPLPLLAFPEGASTNGKKGLLKFSVWPFSLDHPVQPLVMQLSRPPFASISPSVLGGRWWLDVFWFLFVPYTVFHIKILPVMEQTDDEAPDEFTKRVQVAMTKALNISVTSHTSADKVEFAKRKLFTEANRGHQDYSPGGSTVSDPLVAMCLQVKEVLPHVPLDAIRSDLALTKDVDLSITNILEGKVQFNPEEPSLEASPSPPMSPLLGPTPLQKPRVPIQTQATEPCNLPLDFSKIPEVRQLSLGERKKALLDQARKRYQEKNNLT